MRALTLKMQEIPISQPGYLAIGATAAVASLLIVITTIEVFEILGLIGAPAQIFVFSTRIYYATHPEVGLPKYGLAGA